MLALLSNKTLSLSREYINEETSTALVRALVISRLDYGNALLFVVTVSLIELSTASTERCFRTSHHNPQKGSYYSDSIPSSLASHAIQINVFDAVLYIQSGERNITLQITQTNILNVSTNSLFQPA